MKTQQPYVFISYSSKESGDAYQMRDILTANGISCWMAPQSIPGGSDYTKSIPSAIAGCGAVVMLCSQNAQRSYWVKTEIIEAINRQKLVIPFVIDEYQLNEEYSFMLSPAHRINASRDKAGAYVTLVSTLRSYLYPDLNPSQMPAIKKPLQVQEAKGIVRTLPDTLTWFTFAVECVIMFLPILFITLDDNNILMQISFFFTVPLMFVITLIMLGSAKYHPTAPRDKTNSVRITLAALFLGFSFTILCMDFGFVIYPLLDDEAIYTGAQDPLIRSIYIIAAIITIVLTIIELITSLIVFVKYKRANYYPL